MNHLIAGYIEFQDPFGKIMNSGMTVLVSGQSTSIDVSYFPTGIYFLNLRSKDGALLSTNKIIVNH